MGCHAQCQLSGLCSRILGTPTVGPPRFPSGFAPVHHFSVSQAVDPTNPPRRRRATFRVPLVSLLAIFGLMVCLAPAAFADVPGLWVLYVIPLALIVFVVRTKTVVTPKGLAVRTVFGHRELPWEALKGLSISKRAKVSAVLTDDSKIPLPSVRTRHLPVLSLVSGGLLQDPSGVLDEPAAAEKPEAAETSETPEAGETPETPEAAQTSETTETSDTSGVSAQAPETQPEE